jgi:hypothetical protein
MLYIIIITQPRWLLLCRWRKWIVEGKYFCSYRQASNMSLKFLLQFSSGSKDFRIHYNRLCNLGQIKSLFTTTITNLC